MRVGPTPGIPVVENPAIPGDTVLCIAWPTAEEMARDGIETDDDFLAWFERHPERLVRLDLATGKRKP